MRLTTISLFACYLAACNSLSSPEGAPIITGVVVERDLSIRTGEPTIHVQRATNGECGIIFLVSESTPVRRRSADGSISGASLSDLTLGRHVAVWAEAVTTSCPGHSSATLVTIIDAPQ